MDIREVRKIKVGLGENTIDKFIEESDILKDFPDKVEGILEENENNKKIFDVKIYLEKDNKKIYMYNGKISENRYYFDIIMNSLEGIYTINVEVKDEDRKNLYTKN